MVKIRNRIIGFFTCPHTVFLFWGFIFGLMFSLLIPALQTPDEQTHMRCMCEAYGTEDIYKELEQGFYYDAGLYGILGNSDAKVDSQLYFECGMKKFENKVGGFSPSVSCIKYLPYALGFYFCCFLGLPILVCLQIGELFSLLFY